MDARLLNFYGGSWHSSAAGDHVEVINPATGKVIALTPLSLSSEIDSATQAAMKGFTEWKNVPSPDRIQYLFKLKAKLEENFDDLAHTITIENGKTIQESRGEMRRAIENVEVACGIPLMMQGSFSENIASGIDEFMIRQPVGICAIIAPFNFPGMIPFWFFPYAVACGNSVMIKPSERTPITMQKVFRLIEEIGFPEGVVNLVNGGPDTVNVILDHPDIRAISFVGSTQVAKHIYSRSSATGKRVQAQGGAKNPLIILPDADIEITTQIVTDSVFGNAGQRCLAASLVIPVGEDARKIFIPALVEAANERIVGFGLDEKVQMGPVISQKSKHRIESIIQIGIEEGAKVLINGRNTQIAGFEGGYFIRPTILDRVPKDGEISKTEIFGPVMGIMPVENIDEAIDLVNGGKYGNMACLFTNSGAAARKFRNQAEAGNIGINIGVAAPMAFFPFSGWKESFFGTLHGQANHAVEFFTQTKVVIERWPKEWSRKF